MPDVCTTLDCKSCFLVQVAGWQILFLCCNGKLSDVLFQTVVLDMFKHGSANAFSSR